MQMESFEESVSGRLTALAVSLPLISGGWLGWSVEGPSIAWMVASLTAAIMLGIFAIGLAVENHPYHAALSVLFLLPALFLYLPMVAYVRPAVPFFGTAMVAAGAMLLAFAARASMRRAPAMAARKEEPFGKGVGVGT
jgi:hypothetical protein